MNDARNAYDLGTKTTESIRGLEAAALFKAARRLELCREAWDAPGRDERLAEALRYNRRLWTFFQAELASQSHPMSDSMRADLLRLSGFVDRRTLELLAAPEPQLLQLLIDINRNLGMGLSEANA